MERAKFEFEDRQARRDTHDTLHDAYSVLAFDVPYLELFPSGPRSRNSERDKGMELLRRAYWHVFGFCIPNPRDN